MASKGYTILPRDITDTPIWVDARKVKLLNLCLSKESYKGKVCMVENQAITLEPRQFVTGRRSLAEEFNKGVPCNDMVSGSTLFRWLESFEKLGYLHIKKTNKYSIVTVLYGNEYIKDCTSDEQQMNNRWTSDEQQMNTNNKYKTDNTLKKDLKDILSVSDDTSIGGEKAKDNIPYKDIIDYLNEKAGTKYRYQTASTKEKIRARYREGFTIDDFKTVIDKKCAEWKNDAKMCNYLRPETLFGTKFESYLNQTTIEEKRNVNGITKEHDTRTVDSFGIPILR